MSKITDLLAQELKPINLGLESFAQSMVGAGLVAAPMGCFQVALAALRELEHSPAETPPR